MDRIERTRLDARREGGSAGLDEARPRRPTQPVEFFRALLAKDGGRLAVFYSALSQVDEIRQRYFTGDASRARRYYEWYRDSSDMRTIESSRMPYQWRRDLFGKLPLDDGGRGRFPGGRAAWSSLSGPDDEALLRSEFLEALVPVAALEEKRGARLDAASATLVARHYAEWRSLFPYFEKLPALGGAEFEALAAFATATLDLPSAARNNVVGQWHSLVKLIVLGGAGRLAEPGGRGARVIAGLRGSLQPGAVRRTPWRLSAKSPAGRAAWMRRWPPACFASTGSRRASFDRVRELQSAPSLDAALADPWRWPPLWPP